MVVGGGVLLIQYSYHVNMMMLLLLSYVEIMAMHKVVQGGFKTKRELVMENMK